MPSLKLADAIIYYQPDRPYRGDASPGTLTIAHRDDQESDHKFSMSWDVARMSISSDPKDQFIYLMSVFRCLTAVMGADPEQVDSGFMTIEEYEEFYAND